MRTLSTYAALLALALVAGCGKCGGPSAKQAGLLSLLPKDAQVAVVPDLAVLGKKLEILEKLKVVNFVAQLQGAETGKEYLDAIFGQLGVDLRSPEALKQAGLAADRGLALVYLSEDRAYSVVGVSDEAKFQATVQRLARDRFGAGVAGSSKQGEAEVHTFSRTAGSAPVLAYVLKGGYAVVAPGPLAGQVAERAAIPEAASLASDAELQKSLGRLPKDRVAWAHGTQLGRALGWAERATLAMSISDEAISVRSDSPRPGPLPAYFEKKTGPALLGALPENAFLVARYQGEMAALDPLWPKLLGPNVERAVRETGFDVRGELLDNLEPGGVLAVSVAPKIDLDLSRIQQGGFDLDPRKTNPFRIFHLVAIAGVKDPAKAATTLEHLPPVAKKFGAEVVPEDRSGQKVYVTHYAQGEGTHFALREKRLLLAAPMERFEQSLQTLGQGGPGKGPVAAYPALQSALDAHAVAVVVNLPQLSQSIRELPSQAWGLGGVLIRASAIKFLDATDDLRAVTFGAWAEDGAVQTELTLRYEKK